MLSLYTKTRCINPWNINFYSPWKWNVTETFTYAYENPKDSATSFSDRGPHALKVFRTDLIISTVHYHETICAFLVLFSLFISPMDYWCCSAVCPATSMQRRLAGKHDTACVARKKRTFYICSTFIQRGKKGGENKNLWTLFNVCINTSEVSSLFLPFIFQKYSRARLKSVSGVECFEKWLAVKTSSLYKKYMKVTPENSATELQYYFCFTIRHFFVANKQDLSWK